MAKFANPRKKFNFTITIQRGASPNAFSFQKVTLPDAEIEQVAHGDTNHDIKTPGRVTYGNLICEKLMSSQHGDTFLWDWFDTCQSSVLGGGAVPDEMKRSILIEEFDESGAGVINDWLFEGCWPTRMPGLELDRNASENTIENVEFSVDRQSKR